MEGQNGAHIVLHTLQTSYYWLMSADALATLAEPNAQSASEEGTNFHSNSKFCVMFLYGS
jgi:hypothetical protein